MSFKYSINDNCGGIKNAFLYEIEDTDEALKNWRNMQQDFIEEFQEFSSENLKDYELPDWHDGINSLWVYLYNDKFYNFEFISRIKKIIQKNGKCFAEFECHNDSQQFIGRFKIYDDEVCFDGECESSGLIEKLYKKDSV